MAQKKSGGSSRNGRDSNSKKLGLKKNFGNFVKPGDILIKQKGFKYKSWLNTLECKDFTIISLIYGYMYFKKKNKKKYIYVI